MARVLSLCSRLPYPLTGGAKLRMFYTAKEMLKSHQVELLVIEESPTDQSALSQLEEVFDAVHLFEYPKSEFYTNAARGILSTQPLQTHYYMFNEVNNWLNKNENLFDLLYCNHVRTTEYVKNRDTTRIVDLVDAISRNYQQATSDATGLWRMIYPIEWRRLKRYEKSIVDTFDHSIITTQEDLLHITNGESNQEISTLPNGVKPDLLTYDLPDYYLRNQPVIVFLGKMDYFPNKDAAKYFATEIFPKIRESEQSAQFFIVGSSPEKEIWELDSREGITVTGFVEDPVTYLNRADIVVAPMRHGAGLQNKVLEAMALGKPVVASEVAGEGIEAIDGHHLLVVGSSSEFQQAVLDLISDREKRELIGKNARVLIESRYTWNKVGSELRSIIESCISQTSFD
ncbi:glycosyltransferase [Halorubrum xinjiangense]|uniref:glycosyltransferase n=1 Tax=Halorubrum xinjiangense TaxID=261291 RepID=UPI003C6F1282